jgi:prepilin-type processing-associated H-X9-DG protein
VTGATYLDGAVVINDDSNSTNVRVESNGNANMLFVDGTNDRVGIGTGSPATALDINGTATATGLDVNGSADISGNLVMSAGFLNLGAPSTLTIATGVVTATKSFHLVDTQGAAATDDLDTINGGTAGNLLIVQSVASTRDVTLKDGTGNLALAGDCVLDTLQDSITLIYRGSSWYEVCRSNNA